jgi:hypothetical protein
MSASKSAAHDCAVIVWRSLGTCCNVSRLEPDRQIAAYWLPSSVWRISAIDGMIRR